VSCNRKGKEEPTSMGREVKRSNGVDELMLTNIDGRVTLAIQIMVQNMI
jgi:hypothetical protein